MKAIFLDENEARQYETNGEEVKQIFQMAENLTDNDLEKMKAAISSLDETEDEAVKDKRL